MGQSTVLPYIKNISRHPCLSVLVSCVSDCETLNRFLRKFGTKIFAVYARPSNVHFKFPAVVKEQHGSGANFLSRK